VGDVSVAQVVELEPRKAALGNVGLKKDRTVAAICHSEPVRTSEGSVIGTPVPLDRMRVWRGTQKQPVQLSEVEDWLLESAQQYRPLRIVFDPYQAVGMAQRLRRHGLAMEEFTFSQSSVGKLASTLHDAIREHQLALPDDPELLEEFANVRLREVRTASCGWTTTQTSTTTGPSRSPSQRRTS
jgi:hypothetical protein